MIFALVMVVIAAAGVGAAELVRLQCRRMLTRPVRQARSVRNARVPAAQPAVALARAAA